MSIIEVKIVNTSSNPLPEYATAGSSGMDIRAHLGGAKNIKTFGKSFNPDRIIY